MNARNSFATLTGQPFQHVKANPAVSLRSTAG
jgi:hypothetical protein